MNPKAGVRTVPSTSASRDGDGSGKGGSSAKSSKVTTNRGGGSVSWRGQLWRPNELGFQRMTCSLYGRSWRRFLNQDQNLGQAGADLCTGVLGTSTSVDQFRDRLKELTRRVSGLGALFVG